MVSSKKVQETESTGKIEDALCFSLYTASRLMTQSYSEHLDQLKITYTQFLVMNLLWEKDNVTLKRLGERLYLDSGTLTPLVNRLISLGYIKKTKSNFDERELVVALTPKGKLLKNKSADIPRAMFCKLEVSVERFLEIRTGVQQILHTLNRQRTTKNKSKIKPR